MSNRSKVPEDVCSPTEIPLKAKYLVRFTAKFGGKKRGAGNSGKVGRAGRRTKRAHLAVNSGPEWKGPIKRGK